MVKFFYGGLSFQKLKHLKGMANGFNSSMCEEVTCAICSIKHKASEQKMNINAIHCMNKEVE